MKDRFCALSFLTIFTYFFISSASVAAQQNGSSVGKSDETMTSHSKASNEPANSKMGKVKDIDGNAYLTVKIGTQWWMKENLLVTRLNDGTAIQLVKENSIWENSSAPEYCWYKNDPKTYARAYGALYNWNTVNTGKLCPAGWQVPTDDDWTTLINYLGGTAMAGGKLKETGNTHWISPNTAATDKVGFTALPGGSRLNDGKFDLLGSYGYWWSASQTGFFDNCQIIHNNSAGIEEIFRTNNFGYSVRCVKAVKTSKVPVAQFSTSGNSAATGKIIQFTDQSTNSPTNWQWSFGDGTGSNLQNPSHSFSVPGVYTIKLKVTNSYGSDSLTKTSYIVISENKGDYGCKNCETGKVTDIDGNVYKTVKIGNQWWMAENLSVTHLRDGKIIPKVTNNSVLLLGTGTTGWDGLTTPAYCWYKNNKSVYGQTYGALYNWYTVNTGKLCPTGWHVPSDAEWTNLTDYLGGPDLAGGKLKEAGTLHWIAPNTGATDTTGFTAFPGGKRGSEGVFYYIGYMGYWWSSTAIDARNAVYRNVRWDDGKVNEDDNTPDSKSKENGFSVRCVKDK